MKEYGKKTRHQQIRKLKTTDWKNFKHSDFQSQTGSICDVKCPYCFSYNTQPNIIDDNGTPSLWPDSICCIVCGHFFSIHEGYYLRVWFYD